MKSEQVEIVSNDYGAHGEYRARVGANGDAGKLTWTLRGEFRDAEHTLVPREMRGHGIAAKLVAALVDDARREGFRIIPTCSYVAAQFERHPDWAGLKG